MHLLILFNVFVGSVPLCISVNPILRNSRRLLTQEAGWGPSSRGTEIRRIAVDHTALSLLREAEPSYPTWGLAMPQALGQLGTSVFAARAPPAGLSRVPSPEPKIKRRLALSVGPDGRRLDRPRQWRSVSGAKDSGLLKRKSWDSLWDPAYSAGRPALLPAVGSRRRRAEPGEPEAAGQRSGRTGGKRREAVGGEKRRREKWVSFRDREIRGPSLGRGSRMEARPAAGGLEGRGPWTAKPNLCLRGRTRLEEGRKRGRRKHAFIFLCLFLFLFVCSFLYRAQKGNQPILWSGEHPTFNGYKRACIYPFFFFEINSAAPLPSPPPPFFSFPTLNSDIPFSQHP